MNVFEKKGPKHIISQIVIYIVLIFFTFMALYPLFWLLFSSFKTTQEYQMTSKLALPKAPAAGTAVKWHTAPRRNK